MKEKIITTSVYTLVLLMIATTAFIFGLLSTQLRNKVAHKEIPAKMDIAVCSPKEVENVVYKVKDRMVYLYKEKLPERYKTTLYFNVVKEKEKIIYLNNPEKMHFGISMVGAYTGRYIRYGYFGIGFKMRYSNYYGQAEFMSNHTSLFSLGYEFEL